MEHLLSQKRIQMVAMNGDFVLVVRSSPEAGEERAFLASKCGSEIYCSKVIMEGFHRIKYPPPTSQPFRFVCPTKRLYSLVGNTGNHLLNLDLASNYLICRVNGIVYRFATEGGGIPLPISNLGDVRKYLSATYPSLF
jgi:hypothetical protein